MCVAVESDLSQAIVLTWEKNLTKIVVREAPVLIRVKEPDQPEALVLRYGVHAVVSQEVDYLAAGKVVIRTSVESLECHAWSEISDLAETLSKSLQGALAISHCHEVVLKSSFCFKA